MRWRIWRAAGVVLTAGLAPTASAQMPLTIDAEPGFVVSWNGNDGDQFDPGAPPGGARVPDNLGLSSNGAVAFTSGDLGPELGIGFHVAANLNDGFYGNFNAWMGASAATPPFFVALDLGALREFRAVAWGRDNGNDVGDACGGQCTDRSLGQYTLQFMQGSTWVTVATFDYVSSEDDAAGGGFTSYLRHEYRVTTGSGDPILARFVRLLVPASGIGAGTAIDELEVHVDPISPPPPPPPPPFDINPADGFALTWDGNDGDFFDAAAPPQGARAPDNLALASSGATAFSSGDLGPELGLGFHVAANVNDGFFGNINAWMGATAATPPFHVGVDLGGTFPVDRVAWGRDNGNDDTDSCGGQCADRWQGTYQIQVTQSPDPAGPGAAWITVGSVAYTTSVDDLVGDQFTAYLRHEFAISTSGGEPISATGVRLLVPATGIGGGTAIDELEVHEAGPPDADADGEPDGSDNCPHWPNPAQTDTDGNGIGDACECGDQSGDGVVSILDLLAINEVIFAVVPPSPLCDTNEDTLCNVGDILGANAKIFGQTAYCARYPSP